MAGKNHTHKYHFVWCAGDKVWACGFDDCTHYMPKHLEDFMKGKVSICWSCGKKFLLDNDRKQYGIKENEGRPVCFDCELREKGVDVEAIHSLLE